MGRTQDRTGVYGADLGQDGSVWGGLRTGQECMGRTQDRTGVYGADSGQDRSVWGGLRTGRECMGRTQDRTGVYGADSGQDGSVWGGLRTGQECMGRTQDRTGVYGADLGQDGSVWGGLRTGRECMGRTQDKTTGTLAAQGFTQGSGGVGHTHLGWWGRGSRASEILALLNCYLCAEAVHVSTHLPSLPEREVSSSLPRAIHRSHSCLPATPTPGRSSLLTSGGAEGQTAGCGGGRGRGPTTPLFPSREVRLTCTKDAVSGVAETPP